KPSPLRRTLGGILLLLIAAASIYCGWTYSGPYRWIAEAQLRWFGTYETQITFFLSLAVIGGPVLAVVLIWNKASRVAVASEPAPQPAVAMPVSDEAVRRFLARYAMALTMLVVGGVFLVISARDYWRSTHGAKLAEINVAQLEQGKSAPSIFVALRGKKLLDAAHGMEDTTYSTKYYIPVVS